MAFSPGLWVVDPATIGDVAQMARTEDLPVFRLSTGVRVGRVAFFDAVRDVLPLDPPVVSERSWDALSDSLWEGIRQLGTGHIVIVWPDAPEFHKPNPGDYEIATELLRDLVESLGDTVMTGGRTTNVSIYVGRD